ncbi:hypothetical protein VPH35_090599 [Triticum aestivum]
MSCVVVVLSPPSRHTSHADLRDLLAWYCLWAVSRGREARHLALPMFLSRSHHNVTGPLSPPSTQRLLFSSSWLPHLRCLTSRGASLAHPLGDLHNPLDPPSLPPWRA